MKFAAVALLALPFADAFSAVITGPKGKAASSFEEDLALTLQIIRDHDARSTTVSREQFVQQMQASISNEAAEGFDVSVPYDATAQLAYEASDKSMSFDVNRWSPGSVETSLGSIP